MTHDVLPSPVRAASSRPVTTTASPVDLPPNRTAPTRLGRRVGLVVGLAAIVLGSFLPWLESGRVSRNSYAADGLLRDLLRVHGASRAALSAWPFVGLVCALAAAASLVGRVSLAAAIALVPAAAGAAVSLATLLRNAGGVVHPASSGPLTTLIGAALTLVTATSCLVAHRHHHRRTR